MRGSGSGKAWGQGERGRKKVDGWKRSIAGQDWES